MPCLNCGNPDTCRAHILPKSASNEIKARSTRKTLSLLSPFSTHNFMQSGFFDDGILCSSCDGILGAYDNHAVQVMRLAGTADEVIRRHANRFTITAASALDHEKLALFGAAVAWRTSVSNHRELALSGFSLGSNKKWMRDIIFRHSSEIPSVLVVRVVGRTTLTDEAALTAMSYPVRIKLRGVSLARFYFGGLMFLVQTTRAPDASLRADAVTTFGMSAGRACLTGRLYEFEKLADLQQVKQSKDVQKVLANRP